MADTPTEHPSAAAVHALVRTVSELQGAVEAANGEGRRRRSLRSVVAKFRAGEAEEILEVAGRELRHEGVVLKGNKARRRRQRRHYRRHSPRSPLPLPPPLLRPPARPPPLPSGR